jgi:hypothetical protein
VARRVFFSFHFASDFWRTQQVRNMNALEGQTLCSSNDWEEVKRKGEASIKKWIDAQMVGRTCVVVLVGAHTADRPWVVHEISKGWNDGCGVLGIRIDRLRDSGGQSSAAGVNPFSRVSFTGTNRLLSDVASLKTPSGADSKGVYSSIANNIEAWIEEAIQIRART